MPYACQDSLCMNVCMQMSEMQIAFKQVQLSRGSRSDQPLIFLFFLQVMDDAMSSEP